MKRVRYVAVLGVLALMMAACGSDEPTSNLPINNAAAGGDGLSAATCLPEEPNCEDTFVDSGEPTGPPSAGVQVATVVNTDIDGGFVVVGFYFADDGGVRLCEALAESFPPQCGGPSILFDNTAGVDLGVLSIEQGVTWSDQPILVEGEVVDGVFVAH